MCGRYVITSPAEAIRDLFEIANLPDLEPHYNVAPTQMVPAIRLNPDGSAREFVPLRWGLIPHWAKDRGIGNKLINARAESVAEKPSFRDSFRRRRCLLIADGFYEWKKAGTRKQPYFIRLRGGGPIGFAGLWSTWQPENSEPVESCTILTTEANALCATIHDRMPVIVRPDSFGDWLDPESNRGAALLRPYDSDGMESWPVSPLIGSPKNNHAALIAPLPTQAELL